MPATHGKPRIKASELSDETLARIAAADREHKPAHPDRDYQSIEDFLRSTSRPRSSSSSSSSSTSSRKSPAMPKIVVNVPKPVQRAINTTKRHATKGHDRKELLGLSLLVVGYYLASHYLTGKPGVAHRPLVKQPKKKKG